MVTRLLQPISSSEFYRAFLNTRPPPGFSKRLVVANSGGPDSTCLLFLLSRYLKDRSASEEQELDPSPNQLISLSIDHDLQTSSSSMSAHAAEIARALGVQHITEKLPWGSQSGIAKPGPGDMIEEVARVMRLRTIFDVLLKVGANTLAMGHHLDDQVETMLMRLGRGASMEGLTGMKPCRRWGMGGRSGEYGIDGLKTWVVRPLLPFSKSRILATCEENNLSYVQDSTNFQPQLTTRNAVRHILAKDENEKGAYIHSIFDHLPVSIAHELDTIHRKGKTLIPRVDLGSSIDHLRETTQRLCRQVDSIHNAVDGVISTHRLSSPPGTFMMKCTAFQGVDELATQHLLYRICRHISPEPWGHPRAECGRRERSIKLLIEHLGRFEEVARQSNSSICVGASVWWKLVARNGCRVRGGQAVMESKGSHLAWIAQRQPPVSGAPSPRISLPIPELRRQLQKRSQLEMLYDRRFLIRLRVNDMPRSLFLSEGTIVIDSGRPWFLPAVWHINGDDSEILHTDIVGYTQWREAFKIPLPRIVSDWIDIEYIRPISVI